MKRNKKRADNVIAFLELLPIPDGPAVGQSIKIDPWEEAWIRDIYEPVKDDGSPTVRRAVLSVARKNRKSLLIAGLLLATLVGPEAQPNAQIYSAATTGDQAAVIFKMCQQMLEMKPELLKYIKLSASVKTMYVKSSGARGFGSVYKALSAEKSGKHGLGADFFVYDEFGEARDDELWNVLYDSQQLRKSPLAVVISTQTNDPQHPLSLMIDDGLAKDEQGAKLDPTTVCHLYAADDDCDIMDQAQWFKANPTLHHWKPITQIADAAAEAVRLPSKEANFRLRYLNQRVNPFSSLISQAAWKACARTGEEAYTFREHGTDKDGNVIRGEDVYLALDMSKRDDLTALVMISAGPGETRTKSWFWKPKEAIEEHTKRDGVRYDLYESQGVLTGCHGKWIDPKIVATKIAELSSLYNVVGLAYDRWGTDVLMNHLEEVGLLAHEDDPKAYGGLRIVGWGQSTKDMTPAIEAFEEAITTGELVHDANPLLTFCVMNATVWTDHAENRRFDKKAARLKIDGAVALSMALGLKVRDGGPKAPLVSPWEDPDFKMQVL